MPKLVVDFMRALLTSPDDGLEHRLALSVAGSQTHAAQLKVLTTEAAVQDDPASFFDLVLTPKKFAKGVVDRLSQLEKLVANALDALQAGKVTDEELRRRTWELLQRLTVLTPAIDGADVSGWVDIGDKLVSVASDWNGSRPWSSPTRRPSWAVVARCPVG